MNNKDCYSSEKILTSLEAAIVVARAVAVPVTGVVLMDTVYASGRVLATDVFSPLPLPPFDHSAMDGYALVVPDPGISQGVPFTLRGRIAAGDDGTGLARLGEGEAVRVFTGAPLPPGANAVVMQEHCSIIAEGIKLNKPVVVGDNIRRASEDIRLGELVLKAGTKLDPRHIAVLSAMGIAKIAVRRKLRVGIFTTGSELIEPGASLMPGQIYDANKAMLMAALKRPGLEVEDYGRVGDDLACIQAKLTQCAPVVDLILTTGSAGGSDTDLLFQAVGASGGAAQLLKLALKPGKPCIMGRVGDATFLGLPGNPVAALVTFLMFGETVLDKQLGVADQPRFFTKVRAAARYRHTEGKTEFVPARFLNREDALPTVEILGKGGSARYSPLLLADGLAMIDSQQGNVEVDTVLSFLSFRSLSWS